MQLAGCAEVTRCARSATELGRAVSTVSREVAANGGRGDIGALASQGAHQQTWRSAEAHQAGLSRAGCAGDGPVADQPLRWSLSPILEIRPAGCGCEYPGDVSMMWVRRHRNHLQDAVRPGQRRAASSRWIRWLTRIIGSGKRRTQGRNRDPRANLRMVMISERPGAVDQPPGRPAQPARDRRAHRRQRPTSRAGGHPVDGLARPDSRPDPPFAATSRGTVEPASPSWTAAIAVNGSTSAQLPKLISSRSAIA